MEAPLQSLERAEKQIKGDLCAPAMSGLEVVGLVAGIVAAFGSAASLYREWWNEKRARKRQEANQRLESLVKYSGPEIQDEYDRDFRRLGRLFARGDYIGQNELLQQLVVLQQTVISLLSESSSKDALKNLVHPNHGRLYSSSVSAKANTLTALVQQAQRLMQAAPISQFVQPSQSSPPTDAFLEGVLAQTDEVQSPSIWSDSPGPARRKQTPQEINKGYNCFFLKLVFSGSNEVKAKCPRCNFKYRYLSEERPKMVCSRKMYMECFMAAFHTGSGGSYSAGAKAFRCFVCKTGELFDWHQMVRHRDDHHTFEEVCNRTCGSSNCGKK